jgi:hypothetical protein
MFDSAFIDIALGLILFFLILSLVCSAVQEWFASAVGLRSRNLRKGIENLIGADIAKSLYNHGQFKSLYKGTGWLGSLKKVWGGGGVGPSYVEPKRFASILIDVIDRSGAQQDGGVRRDAVAKTFNEIEDSLKAIGQTHIREALLSLLSGAEGEVDKFRDELADWFDGAMDRVSGWYARTVKVWLFVIATVVVVGSNADAIEIGKKLWADQALRSAVAASAEQIVRSEKPPTFDQVKGELEKFPIGWNCEGSKKPNFLGSFCIPDDWGGIQKIFGWLITIIACSFGAPFWFGLLNKVVALRGSGKAPVKPGEKTAKA